MKRSQRKKPLRTLHKDTWKVFSKWIKERDNWTCYTCGFPGGEAGHFKHKDCLDFDEVNINCQCTNCNKWRHGNLGEYSIKLVKKYGLKKVEDLILRSNQVHKFTRDELEDIKEKYNKKLKRLEEEV